MRECTARDLINRVGAHQFLRLLHLEYGVSRVRLADRLSVGDRQMERYLNGTHRVPEFRLDKLLSEIESLTK